MFISRWKIPARNAIILIAFISFMPACKTTRYTPPAVNNTRSEYIATYSDLAIREMRRTGVPASIKMAQAILESGDGNSTLARRGNNHFGIKCHDWTGRRIFHDDDERNECFRRYNHPEESFRDHSDFLTGRPRYANLFNLEPNDYKGWAIGLKSSGYATNPNYDRLLIRIIEENELYKLDSGQGISARGLPAAEEANRESRAGSIVHGREVLSRNKIRYIIARQNDTYESLTRDLDLMKRELSRYNDIHVGSNIIPGEIIYLQPKRLRAERGTEIHVSGEGETMHYISQIYGIRLYRLLRYNFMQEDQEVPTGTTIYLRRKNPGGNQGLRPVYDL